MSTVNVCLRGGWLFWEEVRKRANVLDDLRGNDFARAAPGRKGVENDDLVIFDGRLEFSVAISCQ